MLPEVIDDFSYNLNHPLRVHLAENDLWNWTPENDIYLFHGEGDELVPYENSVLAFNTFNENGAENVFLYTVPEELGGHQDVAIYCLISAYQISEDNYKHIRNIGDINNDLTLNIQDILIMVSFILDEENNISDLDLWAADLDYNNLINVQDIILIVEKILNN